MKKGRYAEKKKKHHVDICIKRNRDYKQVDIKFIWVHDNIPQLWYMYLCVWTVQYFGKMC